MVKLPDARITHSTSARLRIKIPSKKGDNSYFESLEQSLSGCNGVQGVETSPVTGSVLLFHDANMKGISRFAEEKGLFKVGTWGGEPTPLVRRVRAGFEDLDRRTKRLTGGQLDLSSAVFFSLISLSIYQIVRGNFYAPAWYTSLWYGLNMVFKSSDTKT
ncbi:MAG: hypothetical protein BA872_01770 [Desulfobacterales bacterium C00003060]|nr:MAG: hypothetical protein BA861_05210 [Desulfobacterales bacterium S3730MH5]OEU78366.1 MAG: hypothetical protein BA872_01770 [Desulfobacterales bacterium C00003060]